jgi:hypothetical protein
LLSFSVCATRSGSEAKKNESVRSFIPRAEPEQLSLPFSPKKKDNLARPAKMIHLCGAGI